MLERLKKYRLWLTLSVLILAIAIPLTISEIQKQQEIRSRAAGGAVSFIFSPQTLTASVAGSFNVELSLNATDNNITGVDIIINFDPKVLEMVSFTPSSALSTTNFNTIDNTGGSLHYSAVSPGQVSNTGTFSLGIINFKGKATGTSSVSLGTAVVTAQGITTALPIDNTTTGTYTINPNTSCTILLVEPPVSAVVHPPTGTNLCQEAQQYQELLNCGDYYVSEWCNSLGNPERQQAVTYACRGLSPAPYNFLRNFRGLVFTTVQNSIENNGQPGSWVIKYGDLQGRRSAWNYIMSFVKLGVTTFGDRGYDADLDWASVAVFGKHWSEQKTLDQQNGCSVLAQTWNIACYNNNNCTAPATCSVHNAQRASNDPPSYLCVSPITPTPTPTPTIIPTSDPTPTFTPTPSPIPSIPPGHTALKFDLTLTEVEAYTSTGPLHPERSLMVKLTDTSDNSVIENNTGKITYNSTTKRFNGTVDMGTLKTGKYIVRVKTPKYLRKKLTPEIISIVGGTENVMPPAISLVLGDVNDTTPELQSTSFNFLDIQDYNVLKTCGYGDINPKPMSDPTSTYNSDACKAISSRDNADLNDDGIINQTDYILFIKNFSLREGD